MAQSPAFPTTDMPAAIDIGGLHKRFGQRDALAGVSMRIAPGEMVALIGASGSGKSTLLRHIAGFVAADTGSVSVFGRTMQADGRIARSIRRDRAQVGFVFQQFNLVGRLPVIANVLVGRLHASAWWRRLLLRFAPADREMALRALADVGIEETAWQRASTLSGGQQQRAALARCLVQQARLVLADEPIASLDPESSRRVMELLATMHRERGCTVLVSLHQVDFAIRYCPRTIALHAGRVVYDGPSLALTPALLGELYGSAAQELFEHAVPETTRAATARPAAATASTT
jgi:phosphonate transport system ATP-binding protein